MALLSVVFLSYLYLFIVDSFKVFEASDYTADTPAYSSD